MLLPETLATMAEAFGAETAYSVVDGGSLTFAEWDGGANRLARGLVAAGIRPDDRVALHLSTDNALRWIVAYAAIHRAGGVAVPLNPRLAPAEVGHMLGHAGAVGVLADEGRVDQDRSLGGAGGAVPSLTLVVDATPDPGAPREGGRGPVRVDSWEEVEPRRQRPAGAEGRPRPGRHPLHVGDHGAPQGGRRPARERLVGAPAWPRHGAAGRGCMPARCSPSPAWPSSTTR